MDCAECTVHVRQAIAAVPGVESVEVFLASEKAVVRLDPARVDEATIRQAIARAGYVAPPTGRDATRPSPVDDLARRALTRFGVVFGLVLCVVVVGEGLGLLEALTERVPWPFWLALVLVGGHPVFRNVLGALRQGRVIAHTLMTLGAVAAVLVGAWATAAVVVFFMRVGEAMERFTAERARRAMKDLAALAPRTARVERDGVERELPVEEVAVGEVVVVRPGEQIPVDGEVIDGRATVDQATLTGESMPVEVGPGAAVYAATTARLGSLRVRVTRVGPDTTFGRVIALVEEAERHRAGVQRLADRFTAFYLPVVVTIAAATLLLRRDPLATAAVLVVACSCSFAIATPMAMLASIGAGARRGLLVKGGAFLEALARADVLLVDKTGTLTLGRPAITDVVPLAGLTEDEVLALAAAAERYSEHPLAEAVRTHAVARGVPVPEPQAFEALPGLGVRAVVRGRTVAVGSRRLVASEVPAGAVELEAQGKTVVFVVRDGEAVGLLAAADAIRPDVPAALAELRALGLRQVEMLTGDGEGAAAGLAERLGVRYRAGLLPEDKVAVVKAYQAAGHTVVVVGDGVNDAPALAQADVGVAMGAIGSDVAIEAAPVVLMREDWALVPEAIRIARRAMGVARLNLGFTAAYNVIGVLLAALGYLPPALAAAAQSLPDLVMLANSSRLLRQR
jgi:Cd2+/Zn2+-exporting ATPase/Cu+-exporting ATPase